MTWFEEQLHSGIVDKGYGQRLRIEKVVCRQQTEYQDLFVFETKWFGRVLALDGVVQTTEGDEYAYHEMMAHVPLLAHGRAENVLIIGGGDGGTLREALRHPLRRATMVEIDGAVIDFCREHLPRHSDGAFDDPRAEIVIDDGARYVAETDSRFDVILIDSTDPIGPGEVLFTPEFYGNCKRCLRPGGVVVAQNGVPFLQGEEVTTTWRRLTPLFADVGFYVTVVPSYVGGFMTLTWASDDPDLRKVPHETVADRFARAGFATRYYTPEIHRAAFALPAFVSRLMK